MSSKLWTLTGRRSRCSPGCCVAEIHPAVSESGATTGTRRLPQTSLASSLPPWPRWARQPKERQYVIGNVLWGNNHSNFARIFTTLHTVLGLHFWNCFDHNCYVYLLRKKLISYYWIPYCTVGMGGHSPWKEKEEEELQELWNYFTPQLQGVLTMPFFSNFLCMENLHHICTHTAPPVYYIS